MKKRVGIITYDTVLYNKIRLILRKDADVIPMSQDDAPEGFDLIITDSDDTIPDGVRHVSIGEGRDIPYTFRHEDILAAIDSADEGISSTISLSAAGNQAFLFGEAIKLTKVEYRLLERLLDTRGFVSREDLLRDVWGDECDEGIITVYIHYLRRKIEKNGERIIIASRNEGYKIDEKYRRKS